jgi:hypothetical protein
MAKSVLPFIGGFALGALTILLLARFAFAPPITLASVPLVIAITVLYQIGLLLLELWFGLQKAIAFGWIAGAIGTVIGLAMFDQAAFLTTRGNPAVLPAWLLTDLALRPLKPKLKSWLAARLGRPDNSV